ncbi:MAG: hypothetical protein Kow0096_21540 [Thiohalomonadaceae bacterium]
MFRKIRIAILLFILFMVATTTWLTQWRSTDWSRSQWMVIYPINGDGRATTAAYIDTLGEDSYGAVVEFLAREAGHYGLPVARPIEVRLAPQVHNLPPAPPPSRQPLEVALWSLQLRWWAWRNDSYDGPGNQQMFVVYHDPAHTERVEHSLGLQKGLIGVVHAYASTQQSEQNNVIIAHELLHLFGATDKYDYASNQPLYPVGYAEPDRTPLHPQQFAEIMGGRIPLSEYEAEIPRHLRGVVVGEQTAREIRWIKD